MSSSEKTEFLLGPRGFLSNYPEDVVLVFDGKPITILTILRAKAVRQRRQLAVKRGSSYDPLVKPCFIWTFKNADFIYGGWWLYVRTLKESWGVGPRRQEEMALKIMRLFPCEYLPVLENFTPWMAAFAEMYHYPTQKRPDWQGMAVARAVVSNGRLVDVV